MSHKRPSNELLYYFSTKSGPTLSEIFKCASFLNHKSQNFRNVVLDHTTISEVTSKLKNKEFHDGINIEYFKRCSAILGPDLCQVLHAGWKSTCSQLGSNFSESMP